MQLLPKSRRGWSVVILLVVACVVLWYPTAYPRGMLMAHFDHVGSHFEIMTYGGPPMPPIEEEKYSLYVAELRERYGVRVNPVATCTVSQRLRWYVDGYNSVSRRLLVEDNGVDIFSECHRSALEKWAEQQPK